MRYHTTFSEFLSSSLLVNHLDLIFSRGLSESLILFQEIALYLLAHLDYQVPFIFLNLSLHYHQGIKIKGFQICIHEKIVSFLYQVSYLFNLVTRWFNRLPFMKHRSHFRKTWGHWLKCDQYVVVKWGLLYNTLIEF